MRQHWAFYACILIFSNLAWAATNAITNIIVDGNRAIYSLQWGYEGGKLIPSNIPGSFRKPNTNTFAGPFGAVRINDGDLFDVKPAEQNEFTPLFAVSPVEIAEIIGADPKMGFHTAVRDNTGAVFVTCRNGAKQQLCLMAVGDYTVPFEIPPDRLAVDVKDLRRIVAHPLGHGIVLLDKKGTLQRLAVDIVASGGKAKVRVLIDERPTSVQPRVVDMANAVGTSGSVHIVLQLAEAPFLVAFDPEKPSEQVSVSVPPQYAGGTSAQIFSSASANIDLALSFLFPPRTPPPKDGCGKWIEDQ